MRASRGQEWVVRGVEIVYVPPVSVREGSWGV